ncbi:MAG: PucR family transcriptional regulator [Sporichthyaceae bacterium]
MTDLASGGTPPNREAATPTARQGEARDRAARGLFSLVPVPDETRPAPRIPADPLLPDLALIDPARLDVMFDPANLRRPVLTCVLERVAAILDGIAVLQTPGMVVLDRAGDGDPVGVPLRPDIRPEDKEALDRALGLGGVTVLPARGSRPRRLLVAVRGCGELLGYLVATSRSDGAWPRAVAARAARTLALILVVSGDALADREARRVELFDDLIAGRVDDRLPARAGALGHDLARPHRSFAFAIDTPPAQPRPASTDPLELLVELVAAEARAVAPAGTESLLGVKDGQVLAFLPLPAGRETEPDPTRFAGQVIAVAAGRGLSVSAGVGAACSEAGAFAQEAKHAMRSLGVLADTGRTGAVAVYDELGVYGLLVHSDDHQRMDGFVQKWIGPLLDYDREHNAELVRTLGTLLDEATLADAADALCVHTSTLKYRVKRIEEVLGMPIRDPRSAFHLQLATTIYRVRNGIGRSSE